MRFTTTRLATGAALVALLAGPLSADIWDVGSETDNGNATDNTPTHGMEQQHDLGALAGPVADEDWFRLCTPENASFEAIVDSLTGDLSENGSLRLEMVDSAGAVTGNPATSDGVGDQNLTLRFNGNAVGGVFCGVFWLRVSAPDCGTACIANDRYRIRFYDTTIAVPRFNNGNGQVTVLIIQNPTEYSVSGAAYLWDTAGVGITSAGFSLAPYAAQITNLASVNGGVANGVAGTITVQNTAGYGTLAVKAIAVEPATGFSFDSPGLYRPH